MRNTNIPEKQITRTVMLHCIADCMETYATDLKKQKIVDLAASIRVEANRYEDEFVALSDLFTERVKSLNYDKSQMLTVLCFLIYEEAKKIRAAFISEKPNTEYTQLPIAKEIYKSCVGNFLSLEMYEKVREIVLDMRQNNFVY